MPDLVIHHISTLTASEGYISATDLDLGLLAVAPSDDNVDTAALLPNMMAIDDSSTSAGGSLRNRTRERGG